MLEWIWVCMVIAFKAAVGSFFWTIAIALGSIVIASLFGVLGSMIAVIGSKKDK